MYKYLSDENSIRYYRNEEKLSEYLILNSDSTFIYENHKDTYFDFVYCNYSFGKDNQLYLATDTSKSKRLLNTYRDSTIWNYRFTPSIINDLSFKTSGDSLLIISANGNNEKKTMSVKNSSD
ncbi:MAG: hypothetical protein C0596_18865 [Marinilabiliales bacterium]|nr:MAG: hypothetical protein C0596_18865 [Marinilabiliales bacterium]